MGICIFQRFIIIKFCEMKIKNAELETTDELDLNFCSLRQRLITSGNGFVLLNGKNVLLLALVFVGLGIGKKIKWIEK